MYACFGLLCGLTLKAEIMLRYYVMLAFAVTEKSFNVYRSQLCVHLDHIEPCLWMLEHEQRREQQHFNLLDEIIIYFAVVTGYLDVKLVLFSPSILFANVSSILKDPVFNSLLCGLFHKQVSPLNPGEKFFLNSLREQYGIFL